MYTSVHSNIGVPVLAPKQSWDSDDMKMLTLKSPISSHTTDTQLKKDQQAFTFYKQFASRQQFLSQKSHAIQQIPNKRLKNLKAVELSRSGVQIGCWNAGLGAWLETKVKEIHTTVLCAVSHSLSGQFVQQHSGPQHTLICFLSRFWCANNLHNRLSSLPASACYKCSHF